MKVLEKAVTPNNEHLNLEDWSIDYPNTSYSFGVGWYPVLKESDDFLRRRGETWRFSYTFPTLEEAKSMFDALANGADPRDYDEFIWDPNNLNYI